jgi:hypothetical protein
MRIATAALGTFPNTGPGRGRLPTAYRPSASRSKGRRATRGSGTSGAPHQTRAAAGSIHARASARGAGHGTPRTSLTKSAASRAHMRRAKPSRWSRESGNLRANPTGPVVDPPTLLKLSISPLTVIVNSSGSRISRSRSAIAAARRSAPSAGRRATAAKYWAPSVRPTSGLSTEPGSSPSTSSRSRSTRSYCSGDMSGISGTSSILPEHDAAERKRRIRVIGIVSPDAYQLLALAEKP